jgi:hypothetical protein
MEVNALRLGHHLEDRAANRRAVRQPVWSKALAVSALVSATLYSPGAKAQTQYYAPLHFNGAFHSEQTNDPWQSPMAMLCDMPAGLFSDYYENIDWFNNPGSSPYSYHPQAQCQGTGKDYPNAPQVISCGDAGYCMRFRTAPDPDPDADGILMNRSQLAIADDMPLRQIHYLSLRFKFPNSVPNPDQTTIIGAFFHQPSPGRPHMETQIHGGIYLKKTTDGSRRWLFQAVHQKENLDLSNTPAWETIEERAIIPEVWTTFRMLYYVDPPGTSWISYQINDEPTLHWEGKQGAEYNPQLGDIGRQKMDAKIGVYAKPTLKELKVYIDDVEVVENVWFF